MFGAAAGASSSSAIVQAALEYTRALSGAHSGRPLGAPREALEGVGVGSHSWAPVFCSPCSIVSAELRKRRGKGAARVWARLAKNRYVPGSARKGAYLVAGRPEGISDNLRTPPLILGCRFIRGVAPRGTRRERAGRPRFSHLERKCVGWE